MLFLRTQRGITLLETVIYIGLFAIIIPATTVFFLQFTQSNNLSTKQVQLEQAAGLILTHLTTELSNANAWNLSSSTLGDINSILVYTNTEGDSVTIDRPTETLDFNGTSQNVNRLRSTTGTSSPEWITPPQITVTTFQIEEAQSSTGNTVAINLTLVLDMLNTNGGPFRSASFSSQSTISLNPGTVSL